MFSQVKYNRDLCKVILGIWSWSVLQFTMVFTATKAPRREGVATTTSAAPGGTCCTPDVLGIIMSIFMQDGPFLVLRMLLIFKYSVVSYTNMFFTCKNTLVCMLLMYRLIVIQVRSASAGFVILFHPQLRQRDNSQLLVSSFRFRCFILCIILFLAQLAQLLIQAGQILSVGLCIHRVFVSMLTRVVQIVTAAHGRLVILHAQTYRRTLMAHKDPVTVTYLTGENA